jgi:DNA-binding MarR family transcriptional regulator
MVRRVSDQGGADPTANGVPWLTYLVKRVELAERASLEDVLRTHALTLAQYTALSILRHRPNLSSAQLARRHYVSPQAMNQLVAALEREGLIERTLAPENRRIMLAQLTKRGEKVLAECNREVAEIERRMLAGMSAKQIAALRAALERFLDVLPRPIRRPV